jgi:hypothetical protein
MASRVMGRHASIVEALWPPPAEVGPPGSNAFADYLAVPNAGDPRFLLPRDRRAAVSVLRHFRSGGTKAARYRIAALRTLIQVTGGWPLSRNRVAVFAAGPGTPDTIEAHLREVLGRDISLGIQLGPPRANRKPILQVLDSDGNPLAFGKLGINPLTRRLVRTEAAALREITDLHLPGIRVPRLVHEGEWRGSALLITTPLPLRDADEEVAVDSRTAAMLTLSRAMGTTRSRPGSSPWLVKLRERAAALTHDSIRAHLLASLEHLALCVEDWEFGCWHGDWMAWNMAGLDGEVLLWDWERFAGPVPLGWDALHFTLRQAFLTSEPTPDVARDLLERAPALLAPFGVSHEMAIGVAQAYLVELAVRYTADGQREAGGRTARVEEWLLPVLPTA